MSGEVIKLNYPEMERMAAQCIKAQQRLQDTVKLAQSISQDMQNGALVGDAGEAFTNALQQAFIPAVNRLADKFEEISKDIKLAISEMKTQDKGAGNFFN